ncbi:MAG TPA: hypothetical protein VIS55_02470 [Pseudomonadales bacterium]
MKGPLLFAAAALLASTMGAGFAVAAEEAADTRDRAGEEEEADGEPSPEIFVPSEEISEDFAVSFPVDI